MTPNSVRGSRDRQTHRKSVFRVDRGTASDLYVFKAGEQNSPNAVTKEKAAEIGPDFMATFYHLQVGALETQEFRTQPVPFWLVCFSDTFVSFFFSTIGSIARDWLIGRR
jgi:hypothetical protein